MASSSRRPVRAVLVSAVVTASMSGLWPTGAQAGSAPEVRAPGSGDDDRTPLSSVVTPVVPGTRPLTTRGVAIRGAPRGLVPRHRALRRTDAAVVPPGAFVVDVTFLFDADALLPPVRQRLLEDVERLRTRPVVGSSDLVLDVAGHTDGFGGEVYNRDLSARRAAHVSGLLRAREFRTRLWAYGESCPLSADRSRDGQDLPGARALNRRVVVSVAGGGVPDASQRCLAVSSPRANAVYP